MQWHGRAEPGDAKRACLLALRFGYRMIDTAQYYGNESNVGEAVAEFVAAGGARPYIVTKLPVPRFLPSTNSIAHGMVDRTGRAHARVFALSAYT